jgi:hypothetical protein
MEASSAPEASAGPNASPAPQEWSATRPAAEPFVFRSGGVFGSGKKVRTIGEAVKHMDRHPEDGIYHLQNGTLAQWLEAQEAHDLAHLARQVASAGHTDLRVMLETFLLGSGLLRRPSLVLRPERIRMGYILSGQSCSHDLQVKQGRGRGYLFGHLHRIVPWLSLDPTSFRGRSTIISVSVDTHTLPIGAAPQEAQIAIESSASEQPVAVAVSFVVKGMPSRLDHFVLRPLASVLAGGLIGATTGWLLALSGVGLPSWIPAERQAPPTLVWAVVIGVLWAVLAGIRGLLAPLAWPLLYTLGRWVLRTFIWAATLVAIAAAALWAWRELHIVLGLWAGPDWTSILVGAFALAIIPGILGELWTTRGARDASSVVRRMPVLKPGLLVGGTLVFCTLLMIGARLAAPAVRGGATEKALGIAQEWTDQQLAVFESTLNRAIDQIYLEMYDRRAPLQPTLTPFPKPKPTSEAIPTP